MMTRSKTPTPGVRERKDKPAVEISRMIMTLTLSWDAGNMQVFLLAILTPKGVYDRFKRTLCLCLSFRTHPTPPLSFRSLPPLVVNVVHHAVKGPLCFRY